MTTIRHHLTDDLLMSYAAGALPEAFGLVVAVHLSMCDECRARAESYDGVGGAVLEGAAPAEMAPGAFEGALARIRDEGAPQRAPVRSARPRRDLPAPLADYAGDSFGTVPWKRVGGGVSQAVLVTGDGATARLLRIPAGIAVPDHGHRGTELTLVLQGAFRDETDRFGPGDVEVADEQLDHQPVAEAGADCICLAATDAPLRFNGWIPRIAQPFLGI
ncbi:ChrR family anti-sigma-E factor [Wenxinia marina]|uniref:Anti-ECFsigma factor, ChrR n=1 Tax=Wenxinia marina DSM 24838 TaxID=1123501 RepID=A0A0D0PIZ5_9RHOB|nr:ChrR family anti-sigma-E factor [Wenxinia marina]KIQ71371.1 anti-ECFsigma factor, ChrR [Wenxinia marina DSM 24838]GGL81247.1 anti-sigma-E factor ChrR [Wenxinia marina]